MARAAEAAGSVFTLSTLATSRPSAVTAGNRWMQVYVFRDRAVTRAIVDEAVEAGFQALVVTVDAPRAGRGSETAIPVSFCPRISACPQSANAR